MYVPHALLISSSFIIILSLRQIFILDICTPTHVLIGFQNFKVRFFPSKSLHYDHAFASFNDTWSLCNCPLIVSQLTMTPLVHANVSGHVNRAHYLSFHDSWVYFSYHIHIYDVVLFIREKVFLIGTHLVPPHFEEVSHDFFLKLSYKSTPHIQFYLPIWPPLWIHL